MATENKLKETWPEFEVFLLRGEFLLPWKTWFHAMHVRIISSLLAGTVGRLNKQQQQQQKREQVNINKRKFLVHQQPAETSKKIPVQEPATRAALFWIFSLSRYDLFHMLFTHWFFQTTSWLEGRWWQIMEEAEEFCSLSWLYWICPHAWNKSNALCH